MPENMPGRSPVALAAKTLLHTLLLPGAILVGLPWLVVSRFPEIGRFDAGVLPSWLLATSVLLAIAGSLWLCWDFIRVGEGTPNPLDPPRHLVVAGLYRFVRNPGYLAVFAILTSQALYFGSTSLLLYTALAICGFHLFVVRVEEPGLRSRFGEEYDAFCDAVPRWIPRLTPWRAS